MERVHRALKIAMEAHKGQRRRSTGAPYITHLLDVTKHLLNEGVEEDVVIAGILHDTLEDTSLQPEVIREEFGESVLRLVEFATEQGNTHDKSIEELKKTWYERKRTTVTKAQSAKYEELIILLADKLSNLSSIREDLEHKGIQAWNHFHAQDHEIISHYEELTQVFAQQLPHSRLRKIYEQEVSYVKLAHQRAQQQQNKKKQKKQKMNSEHTTNT